jgi:hypothetical protein
VAVDQGYKGHRVALSHTAVYIQFLTADYLRPWKFARSPLRWLCMLSVVRSVGHSPEPAQTRSKPCSESPKG